MIFILGGRGFVGSAFARACERRKLPFRIIDRENYSRLAGTPCEVFINANGNSSKVLAQREPLLDFEATVRSTRASLEDFPCSLYVFLSSCDVYPDCSSPLATREDSPIDVSRQSPYGFHKFLAEQCVRHRARDWLIIRFGGFVGPGLKKNPVFDILRRGTLWLHPESEMQFLHTDQGAQIVLELVEKGVTGETYNVCGQGTVRLQEIIEASGREVRIHPGSPRVRYDVSIEKISSLFSLPPTRETVLSFVREEMALLVTAP